MTPQLLGPLEGSKDEFSAEEVKEIQNHIPLENSGGSGSKLWARGGVQ